MFKKFFSIKKILEIIFPNRCLTCQQMIGPDGLFCNDDWQKLQFITEPKCKICAHPFEFVIGSDKDLLCPLCLTNKPSFDCAVTIFRYNDQIKKIIADLKYYDTTYLSKKFAKMLMPKIAPHLTKYDLIVAVPLHKKRLRERKFNQASLLCLAILKEAKNLKFYHDILIRSKYSKAQAHLTKEDRKKNLTNAFEINEKYSVKEKNIILVDDVMTTGSTLEGCAKVLKKAGANKIMVVTIAKAILK